MFASSTLFKSLTNYPDKLSDYLSYNHKKMIVNFFTPKNLKNSTNKEAIFAVLIKIYQTEQPKSLTIEM